MSTISNPIQNEDFTAIAAAVATPVAAEPVAAGASIPTDKYLTAEDVAATKAAEAEGLPPVAEPVAAVKATTETVVETPVKKPTPGVPPEDRWDAILDNARKKARAEVEGEYAWVKDLNRDDVEATRKWISLGNQNPLMALDQLVQGIIKSNPDQKAQIERYFTSILQKEGPAAAVAAAGAVTAPVDADPIPPPDIPTDVSNGVPVIYSDKQMLLRDAWFKRQITKELTAQFEKDLAPIRTERQQRDTDAQTEAITTRAVGAISGLPGYEEFRAEIAAAYSAMPLIGDPRSEGEKLRDAYLSVVTPKMSEHARQEAVASVTRRAEASTVNPASQSPSQPFDFKKASWEEALRHEFNAAALGR